MAKVKFFLKVGQKSRSRSQGKKFWYGQKGLVISNIYYIFNMKALSPLIQMLWPMVKFFEK